MLSDIFEKVEQGRWVHIFPEGKIEQREGASGSRHACIDIGRVDLTFDD
jgi:hypothetical protein